MATPYDWATFFTGEYAYKVDGVFSHNAAFMFQARPNASYGIFSVCLTVGMKPSGVAGTVGATGYFHLKTLQCDHLGDYQKPGPLGGSVMECTYIDSLHGQHGFFRVGFWEIQPDFTPGINVPVLGEWRGSIFQQAPNVEKHALTFTALHRKNRPDTNYPWNV